MRLIALILVVLTPGIAVADCAAEMRLCTIVPVGSDLPLTQACSYTQCAVADVVFDAFRFQDGSYVRIDYFTSETLMTGQIKFASTLLTDGGADPLVVTGLTDDPTERSFASDEFGAFYTEPCDERCDGLVADEFGN
jgi:hypothetical protein